LRSLKKILKSLVKLGKSLHIFHVCNQSKGGDPMSSEFRFPCGSMRNGEILEQTSGFFLIAWPGIDCR